MLAHARKVILGEGGFADLRVDVVVEQIDRSADVRIVLHEDLQHPFTALHLWQRTVEGRLQGFGLTQQEVLRAPFGGGRNELVERGARQAILQDEGFVGGVEIHPRQQVDERGRALAHCLARGARHRYGLRLCCERGVAFGLVGRNERSGGGRYALEPAEHQKRSPPCCRRCSRGETSPGRAYSTRSYIGNTVT